MADFSPFVSLLEVPLFQFILIIFRNLKIFTGCFGTKNSKLILLTVSVMQLIVFWQSRNLQSTPFHLEQSIELK